MFFEKELKFFLGVYVGMLFYNFREKIARVGIIEKELDASGIEFLGRGLGVRFRGCIIRLLFRFFSIF